jgi:hypothetical protein
MHSEYWKHGLLDRLDGPAIESERLGLTYQEFWQGGQLHRQEGPAVHHDCVREEWFLKNQRHREGGPAMEARGRIRLPLLDRDFCVVPRLSEELQPWGGFPAVEGRQIPPYLDAIFGGAHPFATFGDFGAMPSVMVEHLRIKELTLDKVRFRVSYEPPRWRQRFKLTVEEAKENDIKSKEPVVKAIDLTRSEGDNDGPGIFDLLGSYAPGPRLITLYIRAIAECAAELDKLRRNPCGPAAMTLTTLVFLHELGHAVHHAVRGAREADDLGGTQTAETVAQHFMMTCVRAHGVRAGWLAERLELGQPSAYRAWRTCGSETTWTGCQEVIVKSAIP